MQHSTSKGRNQVLRKVGRGREEDKTKQKNLKFSLCKKEAVNMIKIATASKSLEIVTLRKEQRIICNVTLLERFKGVHTICNDLIVT